MIVDDQFFNIQALEIIMQHVKNINVESVCSRAYNGIEAFQIIKDDVEQNIKNGLAGKSSYKLIFMDCNMPFMDGYDSTMYIRQYLYDQNIEQPLIIAVTGHTESIYIQQAFESGMNQVLSKPVTNRFILDHL